MLNQALLKEKEALKVVRKNFPGLVEMGYQLQSASSFLKAKFGHDRSVHQSL
jgi:hypothetical protein